jgi:phosphoglucosamine mutase
MTQVMINVPMASKQNPMANPSVQAAVEAVELKLGNDGRVLLRPSGTEPVVRVMVEGKHPDTVERLCRELAEQVKEALA